MLDICLMIASNVILIFKHYFLKFIKIFNLLKFQTKQNINFFKRIITVNTQKIKVDKQKGYLMIDKEKNCTIDWFFLNSFGYI